MRALDQFGNSVQVKHAREAAIRHGRLVVAAKSNNDSSSTQGEIVVVSVGDRTLVHSLALPLSLPLTAENEDDNNSGMVAICCTGIKSDADWLIRHIQSYIADVWCRYDHHTMSTTAMAHWIARLLVSYEQNDLDEEWQSATQKRTIKRASASLSRPLGVQTLFLSSRNESGPQLLLVEPTGRVLTADTSKDLSFLAIGKQSDAIKVQLLRSVMEDSASVEQFLVKEILGILSPSRNEITRLIVETLRQDLSIERKLIICKNKKVQSSTLLSTR